MPGDLDPYRRSAGLVDVLDRVLDKGLVVAGDIKVSLAEVELLTIRIRLLVCSIDKAQEIGIDWWRHDVHLSGLAGNGNGSTRPALPAPPPSGKIPNPKRPVPAKSRTRGRR